MAYFSQPKDGRDRKTAGSEPRIDHGAVAGQSAAESVSAFGHGMLVTGNIVCTGTVQIFGRVIGDIHAANLLIGEGARVEGNVVAPETVVQGNFKGTIHSNSVTLQSTAVVDGEILKQSLTIEANAQFEGVSRRLERPVEAPSSDQVRSGRQGLMADVVPISAAGHER